MPKIRATGRCLCGAVTYEVRGPLRDILLCHCVECRRWGGSVGAFAAVRAEDLVVPEPSPLRWVDSPDSDNGARRGFCGDCGSSLFWQAAGSERVGIAAGTLDAPTGLRVAAHIYTHQAGDYERLEDGLPLDPDRSTIDVRWS
ncbi:MAG: GFA family protein [Gaiellaceae bacterium]